MTQDKPTKHEIMMDDEFIDWFHKNTAMQDKDGFWIVTTFSGLDYNQTYTIKQLYDFFKTKRL
jgi:hypothetical protein